MAIFLDIDDSYLHDLVVSVLRQVGARKKDLQPTMVITNDIGHLHAERSSSLQYVLVSAAGVDAVADGLAAVTGGYAHAVIRADEIARLPAALVATSSGFSCVSRSLIEQYRHVPVLTERQQQVLDGIIEGHTNSSIARHGAVSVGTIKREVASLLRLFGVGSRVELVARASELGFYGSARRRGGQRT